MLLPLCGFLALALTVQSQIMVWPDLIEDEDSSENEYAGVVDKGVAEGREIYAFNMVDVLSGKSGYVTPAAKVLLVLIPVGRFLRRVIDASGNPTAELREEIRHFHNKAKFEFRILYRGSQRKVAFLQRDELMDTFYKNITSMIDDVYRAMEIETDLNNTEHGTFVQTCKKYSFVDQYRAYRPLFIDNCATNSSIDCLPMSIVQSQKYKKKNILVYAQHYKDLVARMQVMATLCAFGIKDDVMALDASGIYVKYSADIVDDMADYINDFIIIDSLSLSDSYIHIEHAIELFKQRRNIAKSESIPPNLYKALARRIRKAIDAKNDYRLDSAKE